MAKGKATGARPAHAIANARLRGQRVHGDVRGDRAGAWAPVWALVRRIPRGRVMTYGQIAAALEDRLSPRAVGWALHACPAGVPWQRVVNATGGCSTDRRPDLPQGLQQALLEAEGVEFSAHGTLELDCYRWTPPDGRAVRPRLRRAGRAPARERRREA